MATLAAKCVPTSASARLGMSPAFVEKGRDLHDPVPAVKGDQRVAHRLKEHGGRCLCERALNPSNGVQQLRWDPGALQRCALVRGAAQQRLQRKDGVGGKEQVAPGELLRQQIRRPIPWRFIRMEAVRGTAAGPGTGNPLRVRGPSAHEDQTAQHGCDRQQQARSRAAMTRHATSPVRAHRSRGRAGVHPRRPAPASAPCPHRPGRCR